MTITVLNNQTYFDIAMQVYGDAAFAMEIAVLNGSTTVTDTISGEIELPEIELTSAQERVVKYYQTNGIYPAGALPI